MKNAYDLKFPRLKKALLMANLFVCFCITSVFGITYVTKSDGNWNANSTWKSPGVPPNPLPSGDNIIINHNVAVISNNITLNSGSSLTLDPGIRLEIHQSHTLTINSGASVSLSNNSNLEVQGTLNVNGNLNLNDGSGNGILSGDGTVNGTFTNSGIVAPGIDGSQIKCLSFNDPFIDNGKILQIQLNGTTACSGHDRVIVNDPVTLSGTLDVLLVPGYTPIAGNSFTIMTSTGVISGTFSSINLPVVPGITFIVIYDPNAVIITTASALPIELKSFTATSLRNTVQLNWSTISEKDNAGFDIERSSDGLDWETLGFLKGAGTTSSEQHYHFTDEKPINGASYYRLRQFDLEGGREEFSPMVVVAFKGDAPSISVYPNPVADILHVALDQPSTIEVVDGNGRILERLYVPESQPLTELNVSHYPSGILRLRVIVGDSTKVFSFLKH